MSAGDVYRQQLTPDMAVVVDASGCIVLHVHEPGGLPHGRTLHRVTVTNVAEVKAALDAASAAQRAALDEADARRWAGIGEAQRARLGQAALQGKALMRREAVDALTDLGLYESDARGVVSRSARDAGTPKHAGPFEVTYGTDGYWHVSEARDGNP